MEENKVTQPTDTIGDSTTIIDMCKQSLQGFKDELKRNNDNHIVDDYSFNTGYTCGYFDRGIKVDNWQKGQPYNGESKTFELVFKHPKTGETKTSAIYTPIQLLYTSLEEIQEKTCDCDCQPTGDSNYKDCGCADYFMEFELSDILQAIQKEGKE